MTCNYLQWFCLVFELHSVGHGHGRLHRVGAVRARRSVHVLGGEVVPRHLRHAAVLVAAVIFASVLRVQDLLVDAKQVARRRLLALRQRLLPLLHQQGARSVAQMLLDRARRARRRSIGISTVAFLSARPTGVSLLLLRQSWTVLAEKR